LKLLDGKKVVLKQNNVGIISNRIIEKECRIGLWEINEDYQTLFNMVHLNDDDICRLNTFKNERRRIESLSVRALLQQMTTQNARIVYQKNSRKPYISDGSYNISVTHSHNYTAILLNKERKVGIDIEYMSHDIERIAHKFLSNKEIITDDQTKRKEHIYIHWCAKEALYKICNKEEIIFQDNLIIKPFKLDTQGEIIGLVKNDSRYEEYNMYYMLEDNYVLVYCYQ